jgi:hypothetical protein
VEAVLAGQPVAKQTPSIGCRQVACNPLTPPSPIIVEVCTANNNPSTTFTSRTDHHVLLKFSPHVLCSVAQHQMAS